MPNTPRGREKNITGQGNSVYKRGDGLGTGPVGNKDGYSGRGGNQGSGGQRSTGTGFSGKGIIGIILAVLILGGGGAGLGGLFGGSSSTIPSQQSSPQQSYSQPASTDKPQSYSQSGTPSSSSSVSGLPSFIGNFSGASVSTGWSRTANTGSLDNTVAAGIRNKRTVIKGQGKDTVTIMIYMCGTDLESRSGMATSDLQEMLSAKLSDKINILVYTGGCAQWKNNVMSSSVNQIYKVESGGLKRLENDMGNVPMTSPGTLTQFIKWCGKNYPANRNELILWDHGGGSVSGYGYDQKFSSSGSMSLKGINQALSDAGVTFDFIGFDACLMATAETALMLDSYADYMIASEETEPGVGWYYTNWLTKLSQDTSMPTIEIGKAICDDFVDVCAQKCNGQKTTLSVVDLAELSGTVPEALKEFANATAEMIQNNDFSSVSSARSGAREFAVSSKIDQVDLVSLADNLKTDEGENLIKALLGAVKYNRTSANMTNAYGLSVYFPYQKTAYVDKAVAAYEAIGMDDEYGKCIQAFASMEVSGQAVSGGTASPYSVLTGSYSSAGSAAYSGSDAISQLLGAFLTGGNSSLNSMIGGSSSFYGKNLDMDRAVEYLNENSFDGAALVWTIADDGMKQILLSEQQWSLVSNLELNLFFDDGEGYIDMGLDNVYSFTDDGALLGAFDGTWIAINNQPVAYYHSDTVDDGENYTISGYVPVLLNGERAELILVFDNEDPYGYIAGVRYVYNNGETDTVAKSVGKESEDSYTALQNGDVLDFLCDYYSYDGEYIDSYLMGDQMVISGAPVISNVYVEASAASAVYRFTDLYNQHYWTPEM